MNALFLKDLAEKTRRGLRGRIEDRQVRRRRELRLSRRAVAERRNVTTGEREIEPEEAAVVERIFSDYAAGVSPKQIAKNLNREGVAGRSAAPWSPSTIYGNAKRGTGILNNELYVGRLVWNRQRYVKDPDTGKRVSRLIRQPSGCAKEVPELRIVPDELWAAAKPRQQPDATRDEGQRAAIGRRKAPAVPVLGSDEVRRLRRRIHHVWQAPARMLWRSRPGTLRQPPDHPSRRS